MRNAALYFLIGLIVFMFGAYGFAGLSLELANAFLALFLVFSAISLIAALVTGHKSRQLH
ncbi:MAG: hypothetical protein ACXVAX_05275 [Pseudobdellovibrio sp.]